MGRAAYGVWGIDLEENDYVVGMATTTKPGERPGGHASAARNEPLRRRAAKSST